MHDTIPDSVIQIFTQQTESFDPEKTDELPILPPDKRTPFPANGNAEFISEYRHQLAMLNLRVQSDYSELRTKYQSQARRLDAIEGLVPQLRMQQQQLAEVCREVRAVKRVVTDLQCAVEAERASLLGRLNEAVSRLFRPKTAI